MRDIEALKQILWPRGATEDWFYSMAPMMEMRAGDYEKSDPPLAVFCYEQTRDLYRAQARGATSGGEALAVMDDERDQALGRKISLLKGK